MVLSANISATSDAAGGPSSSKARRCRSVVGLADKPHQKQQAEERNHQNGSGSSEASQAATLSFGATLRFEHRTMRWVVVGTYSKHGAGAWAVERDEVLFSAGACARRQPMQSKIHRSKHAAPCRNRRGLCAEKPRIDKALDG